YATASSTRAASRSPDIRRSCPTFPGNSARTSCSRLSPTSSRSAINGSPADEYDSRRARTLRRTLGIGRAELPDRGAHDPLVAAHARPQAHCLAVLRVDHLLLLRRGIRRHADAAQPGDARGPPAAVRL